jgi:hypothetical protein
VQVRRTCFKDPIFFSYFKRMSNPGLQNCVYNVVHTETGDRTCPVPYLCCTILACEVELVDTEGSYSSCTRVRFLS